LNRVSQLPVRYGIVQNGFATMPIQQANHPVLSMDVTMLMLITTHRGGTSALSPPKQHQPANVPPLCIG
jgi:hypothetical protein